MMTLLINVKSSRIFPQLKRKFNLSRRPLQSRKKRQQTILFAVTFEFFIMPWNSIYDLIIFRIIIASLWFNYYTKGWKVFVRKNALNFKIFHSLEQLFTFFIFFCSPLKIEFYQQFWNNLCLLKIDAHKIEFYSNDFSSLPLHSAPITNVEAIEGQQTHLYCPMTTPSGDKINMVLWFKDDVGVPIYRYESSQRHLWHFHSFSHSSFIKNSFDVRGKSMIEATEWSDATVFGTRAKFITQSEPAFLEIDVS